MKPYQWIASGSLIYIVALVVSAPATLLDGLLQHATKEKLHLAEARGSLWSGSGQLEFHDSQQQSQLAKKMQWEFQGSALWKGKLGYDVSLDGDLSSHFPVNVSWSQIELQALHTRLPADILGIAIPTLAALGLGGDLEIDIKHLVLKKNNTEGKATLQWLAAASLLAPVSPLGDYELSLESDGLHVQAALRTLQGPLQLEGKGNAATFMAIARVPPPLKSTLGPFLRLIGVEHSDGSFRLQVN